MKKLKLTDLLAILFAIFFVVFIFYALYVCLDIAILNLSSISTLLFIFSLPVLMSFTNFVIKFSVKNLIKENKKSEKNIYHQEMHNLFVETNNLFKYAVTNKLLNDDDLQKFKKILNKSLGRGNKKYYNYTFNNDVHEIYTKLKDTHISKNDMCILKEYLEPFVIYNGLKVM
ncbi:hypothetical protein [Clostridium botulinum]|uniref:hypothetical protein n=1 Tax=Clostridium botulinum TaxID=1491 RepID=UPI0004CFF4A2|nr:hypothetical protein [Clostridium botulinum]MBY6773709.1 hypothetical protein [Clostridium botulinum]MBY6864249.1 hypothetical protein [Clostridium botulinum]MBY6984807.1 hypothetical protein [Clostridium botulinum]NFP26121.1 hypothetical protein [Clostridium botulinum]